MKISIIGYGRMGRLVEKAAIERGHKIACIIDADNTDDLGDKAFRESDAAIIFTVPGAAVDSILACFAADIPAVVGTTGWLDNFDEIEKICLKEKGSLMYASNFSIGVNLFRIINRRLAGLMQEFPQYHPEIEEVHHIHKLDHPSGTALTIAGDIMDNAPRIGSWAEPQTGETLPDGVLPINHRREGEVCGIHSVTWKSDVDKITITHEAFSRMGFAEGAVKAAEWLVGKKGVFTIDDMLKI